jgi:glutamate dehydrogenase/leucine dehydrogenase
MGELLHSWPTDDLGPVAVCFLRLTIGAEAIVVVDNLTLGTAMDGVRLAPTVTAAAGLPYGGGKAGIRVTGPLSTDDKERVVRAFAQGIRDLHSYIPGPDMGTDDLLPSEAAVMMARTRLKAGSAFRRRY